MTKEELKKEAEEWIIKNSREFITNPNYSPFDYAEATYLTGAEPREKQIQIDAEQIRALQKQNGELTDKVKELEAQIEKMKCWCNCKNYLSCLEECCRKNISFEKGICYNCKKWELRR